MRPHSSETYDDDYAALKDQFPTHLPLFASHLKKCVNEENPVCDILQQSAWGQMLTTIAVPRLISQLSISPKDSDKIGSAVEDIISKIDLTTLAAAFGKKVDKDDKEAQDAMQPFEEQKKYLIQALQGKVRRLRALPFHLASVCTTTHLLLICGRANV